MKALILRGKHKGRLEEVSQWCNDWFTLNSDNRDICVQPFLPSSLAFTITGLFEIQDHKNNGMLFAWFEPMTMAKPHGVEGAENYRWTFKRRKP